jgi:hypothetical protein
MRCMKLPDEIRQFFQKQGAIGGKSRAKRLASEERREAARKAVQARWARAKKKSAKSSKKTRGDK